MVFSWSGRDLRSGVTMADLHWPNPPLRFHLATCAALRKPCPYCIYGIKVSGCPGRQRVQRLYASGRLRGDEAEGEEG